MQIMNKKGGFLSMKAFGNLLKGFTVGVVTGMVAWHLLCKGTKKKIQKSAENVSDSICSMFKLK